jgi:hypothetical protein
MSSSLKRGGVCNPAEYVLCKVTAFDTTQNLTDGITSPVRLWDGGGVGEAGQLDEPGSGGDFFAALGSLPLS